VLATVQAIVKSFPTPNTPEGLKHTITGRIQALAKRPHVCSWNLAGPEAELHSLVKEELARLLSRREGFAHAVDGPNVVYTAGHRSDSCGLPCHELADQTRPKYGGSLSSRRKMFQVEWVRARSDGRLVLRWTEGGWARRSSQPMRHGFGTHVMDSMIRGQLKGEMRFDWRARRTSCAKSLFQT